MTDPGNDMLSRERNAKGFSLVELLVVIAIIGLLSTLAVVSMIRARAAGKEAKAKGDLSQIRTAITLLQEATGKWPNGCPPDQSSNPEVDINNAQAGITSQPSVGDQGDGCEWTADDITKWDGPYMTGTYADPWGQHYYFDPDYRGYENCGSKTTLAEVPSIVSFGPNGTGLNVYDCDDIFLAL